MAGGGLLQLVAYGSQDLYLTSNATVTFFKNVTRRHTAFSIESIQQTLNGSVGFGQRVTATISRNGDLMMGAMLEVQLPELPVGNHSWVQGVGYRLLETVELDIGGQRIDRITGQYMDMLQELTVKEDKQAGLNKMVGRDWTGKDAAGNLAKFCGSPRKVPKLYIPLTFFFSKSPSLALPLIALQYHEVKLTFTFAAASDLIRTWEGKTGATPDRWAPYTGTVLPVLNEVDLYIDYTFLDSDERRKFATVSHEMLIEQVQFTGVESITVNSASTFHKQRLNLNHPCKALIWTCAHEVSSGGILGGNATVSYPSISLDAFDCSEYAGFDKLITPGDANTQLYTYNHTTAANNFMNDIVETVPHNNPVAECKLTLNGHDRMSEREGTYFQLVQPQMHWPRVPSKPIMTYSFALSPSDISPSGSANFSRIDTAHLMLKFRASHKSVPVAPAESVQRNFALYAINYNVLRILSGMGGLAFSN